MITPVLINRIGWKTYIIFTCTNAAFVPIILYFYKETSNLSLEEIDGLFLPEDMQSYARRHSIGSAYQADGVAGEKYPDEKVEDV